MNITASTEGMASPRSELHSNNFDLIRLFAACQVVVIHLNDHLIHSNSIAFKILGLFPGVPIFFFISGFLISQSLARTRIINRYFQNRLLRIFPGLWAAFAFSLATVAIFVPLPWFSAEFLSWLAAQVTIGQFWNPSFLRDYGIGVLNGSLWTIPIELQFYLTLPMVFLLAKRWPSTTYSIIGTFSLIFHFWFQFFIYGSDNITSKLIQVSLFPWLIFFMIGVVFSQYWSRFHGFFSNRFPIWLLIYAVVATIGLTAFPMHAVGNRINAISATFLFGAVAAAAHTAPALSARLLKGNDLSYGIYLYHALLMNIVIQMQRGGQIPDSRWGFAASICIVVLGTGLLAAASWVLVERPALRLKPGRRGGPDASP